MHRREIFIFVPNSKLKGGVSNYYTVAKSYFSENVTLIPFNSSITVSVIKSLASAVFLFFGLIKLLVYRPSVVMVNPSIGEMSIIRDGIINLWAQMNGCKTIIFWRGWNPDKERLFEKKGYNFLWKYSYSNANKHICLNSYIKSTLINFGIDRNSIEQKTTIVHDEIFNLKAHKRNRKKFIVLFLTRIEKYKGIYEAIEIFQRFSTDKNVEFHIAGDGSEVAEIKKIVTVKKLQKVKFLGFLSGDRKYQAYLNSDCYLFPSYSEGMPNSVLEAMAFGLPIICTKVGALNDFFNDGKMGFSFPLPIDIEKFNNALEEIYDNQDLRNAISEHNFHYSEENFKASKVVKNLEIDFHNV